MISAMRSILSLALLPPVLVAAQTLDAESYNQWKGALKSATATPAGEIRALPGFTVELVRSSRTDEGSWVALAFDPQGRAVISREEKGLVRLAVPPAGLATGTLELIDDTLLEVRGLVCEGDAILANANNSRHLVRLRDGDGDGKYEQRTVLLETTGGVGHGRNQIARHPKGDDLWIMGGDDVRLPTEYDAVFRNYAEDRPFNASWDRFHWSNSVQPPCGHVMLLGKGNRPTLFCGGLRNPFGIAFNEDGEAFTYDADMEWDVGLPWYRPTRVLHLVSGADYGWRGASRPMPTWMPDAWPAACVIGKGSPTSVMFGTRSHFPAPWRQALFILDWAYGIIYAVHLTPHGSTYEGTSEVFLQGRPLNVTSLDFAPDGAMYFLTGGRRTQSGLYRVRWKGEASPSPTPKPLDAALVAAAQKAREQRRDLEGLHHGSLEDSSALGKIQAGVISTDPLIRRAARVALERRPAADALSLLKQSLSWPTTAVVELALAVARTGGAASRTELFHLLRKLEFATLTEDVQAGMLRALQLCMIRSGPLGADEVAEWRKFLDERIPCGRAHADQLGVELLVKLGADTTISKALMLLGKATAQEERLHYLFTLRHVNAGWTLEQRRTWLAAFRQESARAVGAHHLGVTFRYARVEFESSLTSQEKAALASELAALDPAASALPAAATRPFVKAWTMAEAEPQLPKVSASERNTNRGAEIFRSQCAACHRLGPDGGAIGPDLTGIAGRFDRRTILESIIDPWKVVADPYRIATATLRSGEIVSGRVLGDDGTTLSIEMNPVEPGAVRKVPKADTISLALTSVMPPGLANTLSAEELLDLLSFLTGGGTSK